MQQTNSILVSKKEAISNSFDQGIKRTLDVVISLIVVIFVLTWLTPILFILIKLESKGPLFFKQKRDGKNGEIFYCLKYRSMYLNDMADEIPATKSDHRITRIGAFLRRTSIDELPQFLNVLRGDMSIVGPRPHMLKITEQYERKIENFHVRQHVKPGITGLAQVKGFRGEILKNEDMQNRVKYDILYVYKSNNILDLKIIIKTIIGLMKGHEKAY